MKCLNALSNEELRKFFDSFDYVLSDVDGVLWNLFEPIPGAQEAIKSLKKIGKKVILVSNNTTKSTKYYHHQLVRNGFDLEEDEIVTPTLSMIAFLKKQNLSDKEIFLLGMTPLRLELERAGFKIAPNGPDRIKESLDEYARHTIVDDKKVGAVVADVDVNTNYVNLQKAATFLNRPEVLFLTGPTDYHLPVGHGRILIGPGYFTAILEDITKRKGLPMAKPGPYLNQYIVEKFKIEDPSRVLFIGDSIPSDMAFATLSNHQKLLVLSGLTKIKDLKKWEFENDYKPDYYADSLKILHECIMRIFAKTMRDLGSLTNSQLEEFFSSFDQVLCDVHGVLYNVLESIPGASDAVKSLQRINKRFIIVSNNTSTTLPDYHQHFKSSNIDIAEDNIVTPTLTTIAYLKRLNFNKEIFVLGTHPLKKSLRDAGFKIAEPAPLEIAETFVDLAKFSTEDDGSVGAVLADIDLNVNYVNLQKAVTFLKRPDVVFIRGTGDVRFTLGLGRIVMGPGVFHKILEDVSERTPISVAKPGKCMNDYIVEKYKIDDPKRVLFIGDSIPSDMGFATEFGYQKLLVLSGLTKEGALRDWKFPEEYKPDYYVDSVKTVHDIISRIF